MPAANSRHLTRLFSALALILSAAVLASSCGGGSGGSDTPETASLSFRVQWDREAASQSLYGRYDVSDCLDVTTVSAAVYDVDGALLQTGGPWNCTDGQGVVSQVPSNHSVRVAIVGYTGGGRARYRGESGQAIYLPAGGSVDAGLIVAGIFQPVLASPNDGDSVMVLAAALTLQWNVVPGADRYIVEVSDDAGFAAGAILQTLVVDASTNPSCQPDTSAMTIDTNYYWRVQAVDGAGNLSEESGYRRFTISLNTPPVASISSPLDGATLTTLDIMSSEGLSCSGGATDAEEGTLPDANLTWSAVDLGDNRVLDNVGGVPITGGNVSLDYLFFIAGTYRITLQATDSEGASATVSHNLTVTN